MGQLLFEFVWRHCFLRIVAFSILSIKILLIFDAFLHDICEVFIEFRRMICYLCRIIGLKLHA